MTFGSTRSISLLVGLMSMWSWLWMLVLVSSTFTQIGTTLAASSTVLNTTAVTTDLPSILDGVKAHSHHGGHNHHHKCYVCLPPDKSSTEAQEILKLFSKDKEKVKDCADFDSTSNRKEFESKCPDNYRGCLLRIHGTNVSRSCVQFQFNDCKTANLKELCFCSGSLCNGDRASIKTSPLSTIPPSTPASASVSSSESEERSKSELEEEQDEAESRKFWQKGETDDEDLLEMADDTGTSGTGPYPPGVIDQYTTTPKPTLVPNIRGDRFKTTPAPVSGASSKYSFVNNILMTIVVLISSHFMLKTNH